MNILTDISEIPAGKQIIGFHGKYIPLQGVGYIVKAAKKLEENQSIHFVLVGKGQTYKEVRRLAESLNVQNISFVERVPYEDIPKWIFSFDICLGIFGDTRKTQRVIPNKVYEAIAMEKAVISADTPAIRELFTDKKDILLCNHADSEDLAVKIEWLTQNKDIRRSIAEEGYKLFTENVTPFEVGKRVSDVLNEYSNKKVVYTAIFGDYDILQSPSFIPEGWDFVCFTDTELDSKAWRVNVMDRKFKDPTRDARHYKLLPHKYLPEYETSVWIDGNLNVVGDLNKLTDRYLSDVNIAVFDHGQNKSDPRSSVSEEVGALIEMAERGKEKDDPDIMRRQFKHYKEEGYPDDNGLIVSMAMLRRHSAADVIEAMEDWWQELRKFSKRDQLSFNYIAWKNKLNFTYMEGDSRDNKYFKWRPHKK